MVTRWCSNPITNQPTATTDLLGYEHSSVRYRDRAITISLFISWDRLFTNRYTVMGSGRSCQVFIPKKCISWSLSHVQSCNLHSAIVLCWHSTWLSHVQSCDLHSRIVLRWHSTWLLQFHWFPRILEAGTNTWLERSDHYKNGEWWLVKDLASLYSYIYRNLYICRNRIFLRGGGRSVCGKYSQSAAEFP